MSVLAAIVVTVITVQETTMLGLIAYWFLLTCVGFPVIFLEQLLAILLQRKDKIPSTQSLGNRNSDRSRVLSEQRDVSAQPLAATTDRLDGGSRIVGRKSEVITP